MATLIAALHDYAEVSKKIIKSSQLPYVNTTKLTNWLTLWKYGLRCRVAWWVVPTIRRNVLPPPSGVIPEDRLFILLRNRLKFP